MAQVWVGLACDFEAGVGSLYDEFPFHLSKTGYDMDERRRRRAGT